MKLVPISSLVFDPKNARKHPTKNLKAIKGSLASFGQQKPIVVSEAGRVIAGNGTLAAAIELGWKEIGIVVSGLDDVKQKAFALADNRSGELATWETGNLAETLAELHGMNFDLDSIGFDAEDLARMMPTEINAGLTDEDDVPSEGGETVTLPGDVWELGNHRLMCGDSVQLADVEKLMCGEKADMVWTDPPYNVAYEGKTKDALKIENDAMSSGEFYEFLHAAFSNMRLLTKDGGSIYIAHADSEGMNFRRAMMEAGWLLKQCLIWVKQTLVMGRQDYHWKHEPILYGWADGASHSWFSDRKQTTVLEFDKPNRNAEHPTMKPVELVEYCLKNSSGNDAIVLDLFGGSGTTLIACEKLGKKARLMELSPKYCDVIIARWERFTGKKAKPMVQS